MDIAHGSELERAMSRPDVASLGRLVSLHREWSALAAYEAQSFYEGHWTELGQVFEMEADPDKGMAYVALAPATCDDPAFLRLIAALCLEDVLGRASSEIIGRAEIEALRSERFRWLIGAVEPDAMSKSAQERLVPLAIPQSSALPQKSLI